VPERQRREQRRVEQRLDHAPVQVTGVDRRLQQLGSIRDWFPTAEEFAWTDLLQSPIDSGDLYRGVIQSLLYSALFTALAFRHFARRDVTS